MRFFTISISESPHEPTLFYMVTGDDFKNIKNAKGKELKATKLTKLLMNKKLPEPVKL